MTVKVNLCIPFSSDSSQKDMGVLACTSAQSESEANSAQELGEKGLVHWDHRDVVTDRTTDRLLAAQAQASDDTFLRNS